MKVLCGVIGTGVMGDPYRAELGDDLPTTPMMHFVDYVRMVAVIECADNAPIPDKAKVVKSEKKPATVKLLNLLNGKYPVDPGDDVETIIRKVAETIEPALKKGK